MLKSKQGKPNRPGRYIVQTGGGETRLYSVVEVFETVSGLFFAYQNGSVAYQISGWAWEKWALVGDVESSSPENSLERNYVLAWIRAAIDLAPEPAESLDDLFKLASRAPDEKLESILREAASEVARVSRNRIRSYNAWRCESLKTLPGFITDELFGVPPANDAPEESRPKLAQESRGATPDQMEAEARVR